MFNQSTRAQIITRRTYNRPKPNGTFESWSETIDRVINHQTWLWKRQLKRQLDDEQMKEISLLRHLLLNRIVSVSGRTLWLGGTDISKKYECTQYNCSGLIIKTVYDIVSAYHLLLSGCGVGFKPKSGSLYGFSKRVKTIEYIPSTRKNKGIKSNFEELRDNNRTWYLRIGDSSEAWSKAVGKLIVMKHRVNKIIIDFSEIRPAGSVLSNYGWITSGFKPLEKAYKKIIQILNDNNGKILNDIHIMDIMCSIANTLSSRRSAMICVIDKENQMADNFAICKKEHWVDNPQRSQSNNSIAFSSKPSKEELIKLFDIMMDGGGSEPGFINEKAFKDKAPYYSILNPCAEIALPDAGFCNLVECNLVAFNYLTEQEQHDAIYLIARANYRQTLVDLRDGILPPIWHENNEFLRLCGVGLTGIVQWNKKDNPQAFRNLKEWAIKGADSMADELNLNRAYLKTTCKPSGTLSKILASESEEIAEGIHVPLGKYIFNNVRFSKLDPLVEQLRKCNYRIFPDPYNKDEAILITLPVKYENIEFDIDENGKEVNKESAIKQLNRYKMIMENYVEHNCSITVSYDPSEVPAIVDWFMENWDIYKGVSFIYRNDASKTAKDLGYEYLPQEVVSEEEYDEYVSKLLPFELDKNENYNINLELETEECAGGHCPVR